MLLGTAMWLACVAQAADGAADTTPSPAPADPTASADPAAAPVQWAGRFLASGSRKVPLLGTVTYRTESRTLATVEATDNGVVLQQRTCAVVFDKSAGAELAMHPRGPEGIPVFSLAFDRSGDGWTADPWPSGWGTDDLDGDGAPGITVNVSAPLCGGSIMVSSEALTTPSNLTSLGEALEGDVQVWTEQTVLQAKGLCLRLFSKSSAETLNGHFTYAPVDPQTTCDDVDWNALPDPRAATATPDGP